MYSFLLNSTVPLQRQIAAVRDEIDDVTVTVNPVEGTDYFLTDSRIERRLRAASANGRTDENTVKIAAASALDTLATNQAYVLKVGQTLSEVRDGRAVADAIRGHAKSLRDQVELFENPPKSNQVRLTRRGNQSASVRGVW